VLAVMPFETRCTERDWVLHVIPTERLVVPA
jgi:hypothetical protein